MKIFGVALISFVFAGCAFGQAIYGVRSVKVTDRDVIPITCKLRYQTLIVLPSGENIEQGFIGDKAYWQISRHGNFISLKPSRYGLHTNLQLITDQGHVYSFLLSEVQKGSSDEPDLKVFVNAAPDDPKPSQSTTCDINFGVQLARENMLLSEQQEETVKTQQELGQVNRAIKSLVDPETFVESMHADYKISRKARRDPFDVRAIYSEGGFTYIKTAAQEKAALYEMKDGKPNMIQYRFVDGVYTVPKVLDSGYLRVGKKQAGFERRG